MRHARFPALVIAVALAATACSSSGADPEPTPSATTASETASETPSPTPTASEVDLSAPPPDEVTEEYVQAVLEAIYEVEAETIRIDVQAAAEGATAPPRASLDLYPTIYDGEQLTRALQGAGRTWEDGELAVDFKASPNPSDVDVLEVVDAGPGCIVTRFLLDDSPTLNRQVEPTELLALLEPKPDGVDAQGINPAPWVISEQVVVNKEVEGSCTG